MDEYEIVVRFRATHDNERAEDTALSIENVVKALVARHSDFYDCNVDIEVFADSE
jgi:hypothetical protein